MQQGPELLERILEGCAGDEQPVVGLEVDQCFVQQGVIVLQAMSFIHT